MTTGAGTVHVVVPKATKVTLPKLTPLPVETKATCLRIPRSIQFELSRSLTFGVLGDDNNLYPSTKWESENRGEFPKWKTEPKQEVVLTALDTRKHNPQSRKIFHIRKIDKKPVCTVADLVNAPAQEEEPLETIYMTSFTDRDGRPMEIIHKADIEKVRMEHSIVPLNGSGDGYEEKSEMMLPVCDPSFMPSAKDPHKYLARKRRVPPPFKTRATRRQQCGNGVVYPNLEHPRMTEYHPGMPRDGADLPFENEDLSNIPASTERVSVSSLSGQPFSRRRYFAQTENYILPGSDS